MKKRRIRMLSLLLASLALFGLTAGCRNVQTEQEEQTQQDLESAPGQEADTEETVQLTPPVFEEGALSLAQKQDLFPNFVPTETWEQYAAEPVDISI